MSLTKPSNTLHGARRPLVVPVLTARHYGARLVFAIEHQNCQVGHWRPVSPGFLLVHDSARPHVARVCRKFLEDEEIDTIDWPPRSPDLNPIETSGTLCFGPSDAARLQLRLSRSSVMPWSRSGRRSLRTPSVGSLGACCQARIQARGGNTQY